MITKYWRFGLMALVGVLIGMPTSAVCAQDGSSCEQAIPLHSGKLEASYPAGEYWFTVGTWDLPIEVTFVPQGSGEHPTPQILVDFSCDGTCPEDLKEIIDQHSSSHIQLPSEFVPTPIIVGGKKAFYISIDEHYRESFAKVGVTRNVQTFVHVTIPEDGSMEIVPDADSYQCYSNTHVITAPDQLTITANDLNTTYQMPFGAWDDDSIRVEWTGSLPCELWLGLHDCNFTPTESNPDVHAHYTIPAAGFYTFSKSAISKLTNTAGGLYFAKFISDQNGTIIVDYAPKNKPAGIELQYNVATEVNPDNNVTYYFLKSWQATRFDMPTASDCDIYIGTSIDIQPKQSTTYIKHYKFYSDGATQYLELNDKQMKELTDQQKEDAYLYCKITCDELTTITPSEWEHETSCLGSSVLMRSGDTIAMSSFDKIGDATLRMPYNEWKDCDIVIRRDSNKAQFALGMSDTCGLSRLTETNCLIYRNFAKKIIRDTITSAELQNPSFPPPSDGFYYWVMNNNKKSAKICFTAIATITTAVEGQGGTVSGGGVYTVNNKAHLTATPEPGCYRFSHWKEDGDTHASRTVKITKHATYTAIFEPIGKTITVSSSEGGTASVIKVD